MGWGAGRRFRSYRQGDIREGRSRLASSDWRDSIGKIGRAKSDEFFSRSQIEGAKSEERNSRRKSLGEGAERSISGQGGQIGGSYSLAEALGVVEGEAIRHP